MDAIPKLAAAQAIRQRPMIRSGAWTGPTAGRAPAQLGIADLDAPDYREPVPIHPGEIPMFRACGVTPQAAIAVARPEFCLTHAPGRVLVTALLNSPLEVG